MHPGSNRRRDQARGAKARLRRTLVVAGSAASLAVAWPALGVWAGPTASKVWVSSYDGEAHGPDFATAAEVSPDGSRVYVTGGSTGSYALGRSFDFATIAYDTGTGEPDWISRYNGPGDPGRGFDDTATAMAISQDGSRVFVTGNSAGHGTRSDYATIAYDATTGTPTWISRYDGPGSHDDLPTSIVVSPRRVEGVRHGRFVERRG
jgi:hypothetical protein